MNDFYELGTREKPLPAPAHVVWESLHEPQRPSARAWLHLGRGEVEPRVIEAEEPHVVVWSSLWADRPEDVIRLDVRPDRQGSLLRFTWSSPDLLVEAEDLGWHRHRLNKLFFSDLRSSYGQ